MTDFSQILTDVGEGQAYNPYAGKTEEGEWIEGTTSIDFLNNFFGQYSTAAEMIAATTSEGLKLFFAWLKEQGKLT